MNDIEEAAKLYVQFEGFLMPTNINLSLTHKCSWSCVFCYKGCPRNLEMEGETLKLALDRIVSEPTISRVGMTGGEPTIHPYWREVAAYLNHFRKKVGLLTNGSGIRKDDIEFIPEVFESVQLSIHGVGKGAEKVTRSRNQKGLRVLEALANSKIIVEVVVEVLKPNLSEVIPLLEKIEKVWEDTGKPDEVSVSLPHVLSGNLRENLDLYLSKEEWNRLREEIERQCFPMTVVVKPYLEPKLYKLPHPTILCSEVEPDGYLYIDGLRIGSWREHEISELSYFYFSKGWRLVYEAVKKGVEIKSLPPFRAKLEKELIPRIAKGIKILAGPDKIVLLKREDGRTRYAVCPPEMYFVLDRPLSYAFQILSVETVIEELKTLHDMGLIEFVETEILEDFEILEEEVEVR
ncbi:MAG: Radical SAM domain protein [Archaeoglobus fulgidus]|uniref:Radical SAM domain protein n=1 Tax=Archaeoglobus fulgidus TaxID=2234 RepID=A0A117KMA7_ARCFL|nr:radical SAM protein [Archaeoglobus fulgidus]KUJ94005.1 MAG: Radical SAM domain protein [Archaeoglobus fulgidus]KUK07035.1 MAG: Radical SAM domain protein [Archaeoglobus fulgidus]